MTAISEISNFEAHDMYAMCVLSGRADNSSRVLGIISMESREKNLKYKATVTMNNNINSNEPAKIRRTIFIHISKQYQTPSTKQNVRIDLFHRRLVVTHSTTTVKAKQ